MFCSRHISVAWSILSNILKPPSWRSVNRIEITQNSIFGTRYYVTSSHDPTKSTKLAIIGLGNIGNQYEGTRHNIGFACVDEIAQKYKLSFVASPRMQAMVAEGKIECTIEIRHREPKEKREQKDKREKKEAAAKEESNEDKEKEKDEESNKEEKKEIPPRVPVPSTFIKVTKHLILVKPTTLMNLSGSSVSAVVKQYQVPLSNLLVITDDLDLDAGRVLVKRGGGSTQRGIEDVVRALRTQDFLRLRFGISRPPGGPADKARFVLSKFSRNEMAGVRDGLNRVCEAVKVWLEKGEAQAMNIINKR